MPGIWDVAGEPVGRVSFTILRNPDPPPTRCRMIHATAALRLADRYAAAFPGSKQRFEQAKQLFPCGVTHDTRMMDPFPVYVDRTPRGRTSGTWTATSSSTTSSATGRTSSATRPDDVVRRCRSRWRRARTTAPATTSKSSGASWSSKLVPSAERVRFTGSGTEATLMALRLCAAAHRPAEVPQVPGPLPRLARLRHRRPPTRPTTRPPCPACRTAVAAHVRRDPAERPEPRRGRAEGRRRRSAR